MSTPKATTARKTRKADEISTSETAPSSSQTPSNPSRVINKALKQLEPKNRSQEKSDSKAGLKHQIHSIDESPAVKKAALTKNGFWSVFGGAEAFYDSEKADMMPLDECEKMRQKLKKNKRELDCSEMFQKAAALQSTKPELAEVWSTMGFMGEWLNVELSRPSRDNVPDIDMTTLSFDMDKCNQEKTFTTPNGLVVNIFEVARRALCGSLEKKLDSLVKTISSVIINHVFKNDRFSHAYAFPVGNRCRYIDASDCNIPTSIGEFVVSGLVEDYEENAKNLLICRVESQVRESFENAICRERKAYDGKKGPGHSLLMAQVFKGKVREEENGLYTVLEDDVVLDARFVLQNAVPNNNDSNPGQEAVNKAQNEPNVQPSLESDEHGSFENDENDELVDNENALETAETEDKLE